MKRILNQYFHFSSNKTFFSSFFAHFLGTFQIQPVSMIPLNCLLNWINRVYFELNNWTIAPDEKIILGLWIVLDQWSSRTMDQKFVMSTRCTIALHRDLIETYPWTTWSFPILLICAFSPAHRLTLHSCWAQLDRSLSLSTLTIYSFCTQLDRGVANTL